MSISRVSMTVRPQVAAAKKAPVGGSAPVSKLAQSAAQPVKAQDAAPQHSKFPIIATIGTGLSALAGAWMGLFACGMSDAPVTTLTTLEEAGTGGLVVGGIGAVVFFGGRAIIKSLTNK